MHCPTICLDTSDTRIIDQDVYLLELAETAIDHAGDFVPVGYIGPHRQRPSPQLAQRARREFRALEIEVADQYITALSGQG